MIVSNPPSKRKQILQIIDTNTMLTCFSCDVIDGTLARVGLSGRSCGVNEQSERQGESIDKKG